MGLTGMVCIPKSIRKRKCLIKDSVIEPVGWQHPEGLRFYIRGYGLCSRSPKYILDTSHTARIHGSWNSRWFTGSGCSLITWLPIFYFSSPTTLGWFSLKVLVSKGGMFLLEDMMMILFSKKLRLHVATLVFSCQRSSRQRRGLFYWLEWLLRIPRENRIAATYWG